MKFNLKLIISIILIGFCSQIFEQKKEIPKNLFGIFLFGSRLSVPNANISGTNLVNLGGKVTGIPNGSSVTLQLNGGSTIILKENKNLQNFFLNHRTNTEYKIEIKEATGLTCSILNSTGTPTMDIKNADLTCAAAAGTIFTKIGGTVSGITGSIILNMTGDSTQSKTLTANGAYQFDTTVLDGRNYSVSISSHSDTSFCFFPNANATNNSSQTGTTTDVDTTTVNINCVPRITLNELCSNNCMGTPSSPGNADFIELKNISGVNINISGTDWYSCDAGICGSSFNSATDSATLVPIPAQTFNNNSYITPPIPPPAPTGYGLGNGDSVHLVYRVGGKSYLVESYIFAAHVIPARKSPDGNFSGANNSGIWLTGGILTYGVVNP